MFGPLPVSRLPLRSIVLGLLMAVLMVVPVIPASAHATLLESTPSDGTVVNEAPGTVTLRYDQPVGVSAGSVKVLAPDGTRIDSGAITQRDGGRIVVEELPAELSPGTYTILWRVLSADTHTVFGATTFSIKTVSGSGAGAAAAAEQARGGAPAEYLLGVSRFVWYLGLVLLVGGLMFLFVLWPQGRLLRPVRRMLWIGWGTATAGTVGGFLMQGPYSQGLGLYYTFDPELVALVLPTRFGFTSVVRLGLLTATAALLACLHGERRRLLTVAGTILGLGLLISTSAVGHAGSGDLVGLAFPADVLHLAATSAWIGGLVLLVAVLLRRPPATLAQVLPRWSRYAEFCVVVLVITGSFAAWRQIRELGAVTSTGYGRLLLVKLALVTVMLVPGAIGRSRIHRHYLPASSPSASEDVALSVSRSTPAVGLLLDNREMSRSSIDQQAPARLARLLRRTVLVEAGLAVVVLAATSGLVATTPARESYFPTFSQTAAVTDALQMQVDVTPARVGLNDMLVSYLGPDRPAVDLVRVTGSWTLQGTDTRVPFVLVRTAAGHYAGRRIQLPDVGTWQLVINSQTSDIDDRTNLFTVRIR